MKQIEKMNSVGSSTMMKKSLIMLLAGKKASKTDEIPHERREEIEV